MKIRNMTGDNWNKVLKQFIISAPGPINWMSGLKTGSGDIFQSYNSVIAFCEFSGQVYLDAISWDYSRTTGKYRNQFLGETKKETQKKIDSGEYILANLN